VGRAAERAAAGRDGAGPGAPGDDFVRGRAGRGAAAVPGGRGAGNDARFWKLAQSLSALYPTGSEEKRWVDGVLARKKGLGF
jgi:hypothetical protein